MRRVADHDPLVSSGGKRDHRRYKVCAVLAWNHNRLLALHERDERVGGAQIDADDALTRRLVRAHNAADLHQVSVSHICPVLL